MDRVGLLFGLAAYGIWGIVPLYFAALRPVPAIEILAHRIVWSVFLLTILITLSRRWGEVCGCFRSPAVRYKLLVTTCLIAVNWLVFIHGVNTRQVVETSLGYYILPLVSIVLGLTILRERLTGGQWFAVALAAVGVGSLVTSAGSIPWIALTLALTFALYGLLRKQARVDGLIALAVETLLLLPLAGSYLLLLVAGGQSAPQTQGAWINVLLVLSGVVTTVPLYCFGEAARRLPLTFLGFLQYISPTLALVLALTVLGEPFESHKLLSFSCIWAALLVFSVVSLRGRRAAAADGSARRRAPAVLPAAEGAV